MTTPGDAEPVRSRAEKLPDLLGPHTRLLFVGVNPGLSAVAVQAPFPRRGNRFYPALFKAGITDRLIDASAGFAPGDREYLTDRGIGITALVARATARAAELSAAELRAGVRDLLATVTRVRPQVVAILGITAYRTAFTMPKASTGRQPGLFAGTQLWVVPNPSGLNAHASLADLAAAYREVAIAAGLDLRPVGRLGTTAPRLARPPAQIMGVHTSWWRDSHMSISIYGTSFDAADAAAIAAFWGEALGRPVNPGATRGSASLAAREGTDEPPIMFHGVPEPKTVKNRLHLDLITTDFDAELARLRKLGATEVATFEGWTTLADPEGNEFDLIRG